ncbi:autotransporter outer membrane beta-barrel domain-containing protein [Glycocaulis profundi]|nr:autotransporter outer membrane beta-barrel domain-containing protein [Glycocaulis profundi]
MRRRLLAAASVAAFISVPAWAEEEIDDERSTQVRTSEIGDDVVITSSGRVTLNNPGPAVVVDSDNELTTNTGALIAIDGVDGAVGVQALGGVESAIAHGGTIRLGPEETDDAAPGLDSPIDSYTDETGKTGLLVGEVDGSGAPQSGQSAFTGDVTINGTINVTGQDSYGMRIAAPVDGDISVGGNISVTGENSRGLSIEDDVSGDVNIATVSVVSPGGSAIVTEGDIGGGLRITGGVTARGFRISDRVSAALFEILKENEIGEDGNGIPEDGRLSDATIAIRGSIVNGVFVAGQRDSQGAGQIVQAGSAAALEIRPGENATSDVVLGEVSYETQPVDEEGEVDEDADPILVERGYAVVNDGTINASGIFDGVDANAVLIAGRDASGDIVAVILQGDGFENTGTIRSAAYDADSTAVRFGAGAQADSITNTGTIEAQGVAGFEEDGFADDRHMTATATALAVESGADVRRIDNSGQINAQIAGGGTAATAILIESDSVESLLNTGSITTTLVSLSSDFEGEVETIAVDARAMTSGLSIHQRLAEVDEDETAPTPVIRGDILFGSGDDELRIEAGIMAGDVYFGDGEDVFVLRDATFTGAIDSGDGRLSITVDDAQLRLGGNQTTEITRADLGDGAILDLVLNNQAYDGPIIRASDEISFAEGSDLFISLSELVGAGREFDILAAGTLTIENEETVLTASDAPFLYNAEISRSESDENALVLTLNRKTADELGLGEGRSAAYEATLAAFDNLESLGAAIAAIRTQEDFFRAYDSLLPEYAASAIQFAMANNDAASGALSERLRNARMAPDELAGIWIQEFGYYADRSGGAFGPGYRGQGFGLAVGIDRPVGPLYAVGVSFVGSASEVDTVGLNHEPMVALSGQMGTYAAMDVGGFDASVSLGLGVDRYESERRIAIGDFAAVNTAEWTGWHASASAQVGRDFGFGRWIVRPEASLTYLTLFEGAYNETADNSDNGDLALWVDSRTSTAFTGGVTTTIARRFGSDRSWWSPSLRVGYRSDFGSTGTETTARFGEDGNPFTLRSNTLPGSGALLGLGLTAGSDYTTFTFAYDADVRDEFIRHVARLVLRMTF